MSGSLLQRQAMEDYVRQWLGLPPAAQQVAQTASPVSPAPFGPVMNDANSAYADVGTEQPVPVFSDKEQRQSRAYDAMNQAWAIAARPGGGDPAVLQNARDAERAYNDSLKDPRTPFNLQGAQLQAADQQGALDADVIQKAMQDRATRGRR
jgi:hypothetical protein